MKTTLDDSVSISDFKKSPAKVIARAEKHPVVVTNHNIPVAYIVSPSRYGKLVEALVDKRLERLTKGRAVK